MIDLHLHLLPGVDDGAATLGEALEMARALRAGGVHTAAVTPHIDGWTEHVLPDRAAVARRVDELQSFLGQMEVDLTLVPAGECYLSAELVVLAARHLVPTYGASSYLLVEMGVDDDLAAVERIVEGLEAQGLTLLLAHAERYRCVQRSPACLEPFAARGAAAQVSLGSLSSRAPGALRRAAETLLRAGMAQVLATDAHDTAGVGEALALLGRAEQLVGQEAVALLTEENPRRVLAGEPLLRAPAAPPLDPPAAARRWWPFARSAGP